MRLPVYVLFTKADLVAGFAEFFGALPREEREQVWGMTFPLDEGAAEGGAVAHFLPEFDLLVERLNERVLERLQLEPDAAARGLAWGFVQQFASLREVADAFLLEIFRPSRLEARLLLRGVYFTSGTQDGTPIDRLMSAMSGQFGLPRQSVTAFSGAGRSFFLHRLLREVVFAESGLVSLDVRLERRRRLLGRGTLAACALVVVLAAAAWTASYVSNAGLIERVQADSRRYDAQYAELERRGPDPSLPPVLPALATLRDMPGGFADQDRGTAALGFGLYQGYRLGQAERAAYSRALNAILLPRLLSRLETQMQGNLGNTDFLYQALKVYLILGRQGPLDPGLVTQWMAADFASAFPGDANAATCDALTAHVAALLREPVTALPLNGPLVEQVRAVLRQTPLARRSYARIIGSEEAQALPMWRYSEHAGAAAASVLVLRSGRSLDTGVDGLWTFAGYHDVFAHLLPTVTQDVAEDSWVLGRGDRVAAEGTQIAQLRRDVLGLYLDDYVRRWDALILDVQVKPFRTMSDGLDELNTLSGPNSPLRALFGAFDVETQLDQRTQGGRLAQAASQVATGEATRELNRAAAVGTVINQRDRRIATMLGGVFVPGAAVPDPASRVNDHFRWLHGFVGTPEKPGPIEQVLAKMGQIYASFSQVAASPNAAAALLGAASANSGSSLAAQLDALGRTLPSPVAAMIGTVSQSSTAVTSSGARQGIEDAWTSRVAPLCAQALTDRYPLVAGSATDVPMDDFIRLLGPGGLIAKFFDEQLRPFVDTTSRPWRWNGADNSQLGLSANTLTQFQLAADIRDALFPGGASAVSVRFEITPTSLDPGVGQVDLDVDGQTLSYAHGPPQPMRMQWPGPAGRNQVRLTMSPVGGSPSVVTREGPWALFRLLDGAKASELPGGPRHLHLHGGGRQRLLPRERGQRGEPLHPAGAARLPLPGDAVAAADAVPCGVPAPMVAPKVALAAAPVAPGGPAVAAAVADAPATAREAATASHVRPQGVARTVAVPSSPACATSAAAGAATVSSGRPPQGGTVQLSGASAPGVSRASSASTSAFTSADGLGGTGGGRNGAGRTAAASASLRPTAACTWAKGRPRGSAPKLAVRRATAESCATADSTSAGSASGGSDTRASTCSCADSVAAKPGAARSSPSMRASASSGASAFTRAISGRQGASDDGATAGSPIPAEGSASDAPNSPDAPACSTRSAWAFSDASADQGRASAARTASAGRRAFRVATRRASPVTDPGSSGSSPRLATQSSRACTSPSTTDRAAGGIGGAGRSSSSHAGSGCHGAGAGSQRAASHAAASATSSASGSAARPRVADAPTAAPADAPSRSCASAAAPSPAPTARLAAAVASRPNPASSVAVASWQKQLMLARLRPSAPARL